VARRSSAWLMGPTGHPAGEPVAGIGSPGRQPGHDHRGRWSRQARHRWELSRSGPQFGGSPASAYSDSALATCRTDTGAHCTGYGGTTAPRPAPSPQPSGGGGGGGGGNCTPGYSPCIAPGPMSTAKVVVVAMARAMPQGRSASAAPIPTTSTQIATASGASSSDPRLLVQRGPTPAPTRSDRARRRHQNRRQHLGVLCERVGGLALRLPASGNSQQPLCSLTGQVVSQCCSRKVPFPP
jgi:hypothetical protein